MISQIKALQMIFLILFITGVLGNSFLFCIYCFNYGTGYKKRCIYPILIHLTFANVMLLLLKGILEIIRVWRWEDFLSDNVCKFIIYLQTVFRGLSLSSTSLMSAFQAITISPISLFSVKIKRKAPKCVLPCCLLCWIFSLLIDVFVPLYVTGLRNSTVKGRMSLWLCSLDVNSLRSLKPIIWQSLYDFIFVGIMACSSIYMVFILYRHHYQVKHIHNTNLASSVSPEIQATKSILLLVGTFVCFSTVSGPFLIYIEVTKRNIPWAYYVFSLLSMSFQSVSPFVLLSSDTQMPRFYFVL